MPAYLHDGSMGDIIYALPVLRAQPGTLSVTKQKQLDFLAPLLSLQPYVEGITNSMTGDIDLRKYREISEADLSKHLALCHAEAAGVAVDLSTPWLHGVTPRPRRSIIINRTGRYGGDMDYSLLRHYEWKAGFVGSRKEYINFSKKFYVTAEYIPVENALELAQVISGSRLFIGNQSLAFAIAEALAHPRVLEVSHEKPNCMPQSAGGTTELTRGRIDEWLR